MSDSAMELEINENSELKHKHKHKNRALIVSNIIFSVFYTLFSWIIAFLGFMFLSLGSSSICLLLASLLFLLTPIFCIFGIVFSIILRKKGKYTASFLVQFTPFATLGIALVLFIFSMVLK